jgi:osmotically-inducible protein OsmY
MRPLAFLTAAVLLCAGCEFRAPPARSAPESLSRAIPSAANQAPAQPAVLEPTPRAVIPPPQALTDAAITGRIRSEIRADPGMAGADVSVHTDNGVVVLSGTVKSHEQTGIASAHAQSQDGVLRVDNHLRPALS